MKVVCVIIIQRVWENGRTGLVAQLNNGGLRFRLNGVEMDGTYELARYDIRGNHAGQQDRYGRH